LSRVTPDPPQFWIIAGPNGSGKSSFYQHLLIQKSGRSFWIINPDQLAARIAEREGSAEANLEAVRRIETWLEASLRAYQNVGVETVLSTDKYRRLVVLAKGLGFRLHLIYVILDRPERCIERVRMRVAKGGHAVPENKVLERYGRSLQQLPWFLEAADFATVFDNSGREPRLIAEKTGSTLVVDRDALPSIRDVAKLIQT
jgi:predicted ABC-type ATPase